MGAALSIALSGLRASQQQIDITAQNVANANVEGYSRQRAVAVTRTGPSTVQGSLGGGVDIQQVERLSDRWTASHLRSELTGQGYYSQLSSSLSQLESIFNEQGTKGLGDALNGLFTSAQNLVDNPEDTGTRAAFTGSAQLLTTRLHDASSQLDTIAGNVSAQLRDQVTAINGQLDELAALNNQISGSPLGNSESNTVKDRRDSLLNKLASELGASTQITTDERNATVSLGGVNLVDGAHAEHLTYAGGDFKLADGTVVDVTSGQVGALAEMLNPTDGVLQRYGAELDSFASSLASSFNGVHATGYGLDGGTGRALFTGTTAGTLAVNQDLLDDPTHVAASSNGAAGNGDTAAAMVALKSQPLVGSLTLTEFHQQLVSAIGAETATATGQSNSLEALTNDLKSQDASVKGVSLDEEMTNLIQFQQAYNAASRVISIVNSMTQNMLSTLQ